jgi:membrane-associated phospholipid phosphatase
LYRFGPLPGLVLSVVALIGFGLTHFYRLKGLYRYRKQMLVVGLTCLLGAGLLVNGILKPGWGRPRPRQVVEFGGSLEFRHPFQPGVPGEGESFPSGHASMGFLLITLACFRSCIRGQAIFGAAIGVQYGSLIGLGRIVQGGHFFTDVLYSLGVMSMVAIALNDLILPRFFEDKPLCSAPFDNRKTTLNGDEKEGVRQRDPGSVGKSPLIKTDFLCCAISERPRQKVDQDRNCGLRRRVQGERYPTP